LALALRQLLKPVLDCWRSDDAICGAVHIGGTQVLLSLFCPNEKV
jgi:hypothetical protein